MNITNLRSANQPAYQNLNQKMTVGLGDLYGRLGGRDVLNQPPANALRPLASRALSPVYLDDEDWVKVDILKPGKSAVILRVYTRCSGRRDPWEDFVIKIPLKQEYNLHFWVELSCLRMFRDCPYVVKLLPGTPLPKLDRRHPQARPNLIDAVDLRWPPVRKSSPQDRFGYLDLAQRKKFAGALRFDESDRSMFPIGYDYSIPMENAGPNIYEAYLKVKKQMPYKDLQIFAWQVLATLSQWREGFVHVDPRPEHTSCESGFVHVDLKPENMSYDSQEKKTTIYDLGLGYFRSVGKGAKLGTCEYSAPECHLQIKRDTQDVPSSDVWSLGCMLYELVTGELLFAYGRSGRDFDGRFFNLIELALGERPPADMIAESCGKARKFFRQKQPSPDLSRYFDDAICRAYPRGINPEPFIDLLHDMLRCDPRERISPEEAMQHPFFLVK